MRAVIQRVSRAKVRIDGHTKGEIGKGLLILLGIGKGDTNREANDLLEKVIHLRIFEDAEGKMNLSLLDVSGDLMVISQFTLYADCRRGRRPSFTDAGSPEEAEALYDYFINQAKSRGMKVASGTFQAVMEVDLVNFGPVTILLDSAKDF
jgi:D-tyrosyl-tRNA(Tyr) deacylase